MNLAHMPENILMRLCQPYENLLQKVPKWYEVNVSQSSLSSIARGKRFGSNLDVTEALRSWKYNTSSCRKRFWI